MSGWNGNVRQKRNVSLTTFNRHRQPARLSVRPRRKKTRGTPRRDHSHANAPRPPSARRSRPQKIRQHSPTRLLPRSMPPRRVGESRRASGNVRNKQIKGNSRRPERKRRSRRLKGAGRLSNPPLRSRPHRRRLRAVPRASLRQPSRRLSRRNRNRRVAGARSVCRSNFRTSSSHLKVPLRARHRKPSRRRLLRQMHRPHEHRKRPRRAGSRRDRRRRRPLPARRKPMAP